MLYTRNYHNIVNQLYFNKNLKVKHESQEAGKEQEIKLKNSTRKKTNREVEEKEE